MEILFNEIPKDAIGNYELIGLGIPNYEVRVKDFSRIDSMLKMLVTAGIKGKEKLIISFSGYDDTNDEVFVIQEIRDYVNTLFSRHPFLFYYLSAEQATKLIVFACLCNLQSSKPLDYKTIKDFAFDKQPISDVELSINLEENADLIKDIANKTIALGDSREEAQRIISEIMSAPCSPPNDPETFNLEDEVDRLNEAYWTAFTKSGF